MEFFPTNSIFLKIGTIEIHMYAICIIVGALIAYLIGQHNFKKRGYSSEILSDYFVFLLGIGIIGTRIWYVIFMWNEIYAANPISALYINQGGLAIQGGLFTGLIYSYWYFKKHDIKFFQAGDDIMPGVLIAQASGRWGNFFNQEAHGGETTLDFLKSLHLPNFIIEGMNINGTYYQPTFLYESVLNVIGFILIYFGVRKIQKRQGTQFFSYFIWYGVIRFFVEGMRTDSLYVYGFRTAQLISILFFLVGIIGMVYIYLKKEKN